MCQGVRPSLLLHVCAHPLQMNVQNFRYRLGNSLLYGPDETWANAVRSMPREPGAALNGQPASELHANDTQVGVALMLLA